jgi:hypothetical protein
VLLHLLGGQSPHPLVLPDAVDAVDPRVERLAEDAQDRARSLPGADPGPAGDLRQVGDPGQKQREALLHVRGLGEHVLPALGRVVEADATRHPDQALGAHAQAPLLAPARHRPLPDRLTLGRADLALEHGEHAAPKVAQVARALGCVEHSHGLTEPLEDRTRRS